MKDLGDIIAIPSVAQPQDDRICSARMLLHRCDKATEIAVNDTT